MYSNKIDPSLEEQYDARAASDNVDEILAQHRTWSESIRQTFPPQTVHYGKHSLEVMDVFSGTSESPVIFLVHGGYWRGSSRKDVTFLATNALEQDACVVSVDYPLAPDARLDEIMTSIRAAYSWVCSNIADYGGNPEKITVVGHSAGGHLIASLLTPPRENTSWQQPQRFIGVSGLYDLRPLLSTKVNTWLKLDQESAELLSPALQPIKEIHTESLIIAGALESAEFRRQSDYFAEVLRTAGAPVKRYDVTGAGHFDVLNALTHDDVLVVLR